MRPNLFIEPTSSLFHWDWGQQYCSRVFKTERNTGSVTECGQHHPKADKRVGPLWWHDLDTRRKAAHGPEDGL